MPKLAEFDVQTRDGEYEVEGYPVGETLAVTRVVRTGEDGEFEYDPRHWTVTHLPTGRAVAGAESWPLKKKLAMAFAQAAVDLGFDSAHSSDPLEAGDQLIKAGLGDLVLVLRLEALPEKSSDAGLAVISRYVASRLRGSPPRHDRRGARRVPAAKPRKRRARASSAKKKQERQVEAIDLLALARRARAGNPSAGSQTMPLW